MLHTKSNDGTRIESCHVQPMIRSPSRVRCDIDRILAKVNSSADGDFIGKVTISSKFRDLHAASPQDSLTGSVVEKLTCVSDSSSSSSSDIKRIPLSPTYICRSSDSLQSNCNSQPHYAAVDFQFPTSPVENPFLTSYEARTQQRKCHTSKKSAYYGDPNYSSKSHSLKNRKPSIPREETSTTIKSVLVCNPCAKSGVSLKENFKSEIGTSWIKEKAYSRKTNDLRNITARSLRSNKCVSLIEESQHCRSALTHAASEYCVKKELTIRGISRKNSARDENNLMDRCRFKDHDSTKWPESKSPSRDNQTFKFSGAISMETFENEPSSFSDYKSAISSSDLDIDTLRLASRDGGRCYAADHAFGGEEEDIGGGLLQRHDEASCARVRSQRRFMESRNKTIRIAPTADFMKHCTNVVTKVNGSRNESCSSFESHDQEIKEVERRATLNSSTDKNNKNYATSEEHESQIKICTANSPSQISSQTLNNNCITKNTIQKVPYDYNNLAVDCSKEVVENNRITWREPTNRASSTDRKKSWHRRTKGQRHKTLQVQLPTGLQGKVKESIPEVILSQNPYKDFRHSMISMILEKDLKRATDLEELLQCYLSLNAPHFSSVIVQAFSELWFQIFGGSW